jgi:hypothetical protein
MCRDSVQPQRFLVITGFVQIKDVRDGFGKDVGEGGDAACGADGEAAEEEVGLAAKDGEFVCSEGRGETGDFTDGGAG